jgi:hypothetical protein
MATKTQTDDTTGLAETAAVVAEAAAQVAEAEQPEQEAPVEPEADAEAPAAEVEGDVDAAAEEVELVDGVDPAIAELNACLVAMVHPEGGTCDLYESDKDGNILVPATEVASMVEHGFTTVVAHEAAETKA